jgi:mRNA degradation ribonuclease J1/J2
MVPEGGAEIAYIHTSGHASLTDLRAFAAAIRPKVTVPVHGVKWDEESHSSRYEYANRGCGTPLAV